MNEPLIRMTTAPAAYDGFGTTTRARSHEPRPWREVAIPPEALDWQANRYVSGMYPCLTAEEWREQYGAVEMEHAPTCVLCGEPIPCPDDCTNGHAADCLDEDGEWTSTPQPGCQNPQDHDGRPTTALADAKEDPR